MTVRLDKRASLNLEKARPGLSQVMVGLGWDPAAPPAPKGFFGKVFGGGGDKPKAIDLDASAILLGRDLREIEIVYFGKLASNDKSVRHRGDNLTGEGEGDDEIIDIDLDRLPGDVVHVVVTVNSFRGQTFDTVANATARLVDRATDTEICRFDLAERGAHTAIVMAALSRTPQGWIMSAIGRTGSGRTASELIPLAADAVRNLAWGT